MKQAWLELPERSNLFWLNTIKWISLRVGRWLSLLLLYPITAYFVVFSYRTRTASRDFLRRVLGRDCGWVEVFHHYHTFACTLLDRVYIFAGQGRRLDIRIQGLEVLDSYARSGRGCLLVGAHLGSFEIVRAVGLLRGEYLIKALVYGEGTPLISGLFQKLNPSLFEDIIYMGGVGSLVGLDEHAHQGGIIALLGDRSVHASKRVSCEFFGKPAWFPETRSYFPEFSICLWFCSSVCIGAMGAMMCGSNTLQTHRIPSGTGVRLPSMASCSATPIAWNIIVGLRLITGSIFMTSGSRTNRILAVQVHFMERPVQHHHCSELPATQLIKRIPTKLNMTNFFAMQWHLQTIIRFFLESAPRSAALRNHAFTFR
jgi:predicted LPLAT superfamily acyltransferase